MPKTRDGLPYYTLARNIDSRKQELFATTGLNATQFGTILRDNGYVVGTIFSEANYKRIVNKAACSGPASLTRKEIHIHDTYPIILSGRPSITYIEKESSTCLKPLNQNI